MAPSPSRDDPPSHHHPHIINNNNNTPTNALPLPPPLECSATTNTTATTNVTAVTTPNTTSSALQNSPPPHYFSNPFAPPPPPRHAHPGADAWRPFSLDHERVLQQSYMPCTTMYAHSLPPHQPPQQHNGDAASATAAAAAAAAALRNNCNTSFSPDSVLQDNQLAMSTAEYYAHGVQTSAVTSAPLAHSYWRQPGEQAVVPNNAAATAAEAPSHSAPQLASNGNAAHHMACNVPCSVYDTSLDNAQSHLLAQADHAAAVLPQSTSGANHMLAMHSHHSASVPAANALVSSAATVAPTAAATPFLNADTLAAAGAHPAARASGTSSSCSAFGDRAGVRWSKEEDDLLLHLSKDVGVVKGRTMKQVAERMAQMGYRRSHRACQTRRLRLESLTLESRRNALQLSE
ncbi:hypothetical protein BWQ96_08729 [Gracilariopsis chorda]|uniref:Myb-like domain-containing protein n=1 Tax=Gracilariopsis chorda TaxID=448386 RepID=A0A2V3IHD5_9FLOR|nr:hypothetical protein BWQ96_08729 [Gracilariopsis chorda]|eukprot:PXF41526.1 hypothetical protein BWQ96_08729 [Gracilariopsis chorda]